MSAANANSLPLPVRNTSKASSSLTSASHSSTAQKSSSTPTGPSARVPLPRTWPTAPRTRPESPTPSSSSTGSSKLGNRENGTDFNKISHLPATTYLLSKLYLMLVPPRQPLLRSTSSPGHALTVPSGSTSGSRYPLAVGKLTFTLSSVPRERESPSTQPPCPLLRTLTSSKTPSGGMAMNHNPPWYLTISTVGSGMTKCLG